MTTYTKKQQTQRLLRIVIIGKYACNTYHSVKSAINVVKRNQKAGYKGYITETQ